MRPILYSHPFSSYCQKVLIALYENDTQFETRMLGPEDPEAYRELSSVWPVKRFPMLMDQDKPVFEASIIIEYLQLHYPGPITLIPADADAAIEIRMLDRFFDNYISTPQQKLVFNAIRPKTAGTPMACRRRATCWTPPMAGSTGGWQAANGRSATTSAWQIAPPRLRSSMPTGAIRSAAASPT
jgi:glutathione S-transferase